MGLNFYTTSKYTYTSISRILLYEKIDVNSIYKVIDVYAYLDVMYVEVQAHRHIANTLIDIKVGA